MKNILPPSVVRDILTALKGVGALLTGATVQLFKNDFTPDSDSVLADFTEADFDGYAASAAITWGTPYTDTLGTSHLPGDDKQFTCTGSTTPNLIYGFWVENGGDLLFSKRFRSAIPINLAGDAVLVDPTFELEAADEDSTNTN